jgi:hypothetical protein
MKTKNGRAAGTATAAGQAASTTSGNGGGGEHVDTRELLKVLTAFRRGDFGARMGEASGLQGRIAETLNEIIDLCDRNAKEFERVGRAVGREGKTNVRVNIGPVGGSWNTAADAVNTLIGDMVQPSTEMARVIAGVAKGDLTQSMPLDVDGRPLKGEFYRTARVVNTMVDQLNSFASEVTRVAREVGTEGKLGGQAEVKGVAGTWRESRSMRAVRFRS